MKLALLIIAGLALSSAAILALDADSGYVLIRVAGYNLETSLAVLIVATLLLIALVYLLVRLVIRTWHAPKDIAENIQESRYKKAQLDMQMGLADLSVGKWRTAERRLMRRAERSDNPVIGYIGAAQAAAQLGSSKRRDDYLEKALAVDPKAALAINLAKVDMLLQNGNYPAALIVATELRKENDENPLVLQKLFDTYYKLQDWEALTGLMADVRQAKIYPNELLNKRSERIFFKRIQQFQQPQPAALTNEDGEMLQRETVDEVWEKIPRAQRSVAITIAYVKALLVANRQDVAIAAIETELKHLYIPELVLRYGWLQKDSAQKGLRHLEAWQKSYGDKPEILLSIARLCAASELWGKAKASLEQCLAIAPSAEAWQSLGAVLEQSGDQEAALQAYRAATESSKYQAIASAQTGVAQIAHQS